MKFKFVFLFLLLANCSILFAQNKLTDQKSFVRISKKNPHYFELSNGNPYIPVGPNICFPRLISDEEEAFESLEMMYKQLSDNKANFSRIYLGAAFYDIEKKMGEFDQHQIDKIDRILALAAKYNIRVKFCFEHFRSLNNKYAVFATSAHFDKPIYQKDNGGLFNDANEFFSTEEGKQVYLKRVKFFTDRYKNNPNVFGWELWNEFDVVDMDNKPQSTRDWTEDMLARVKKLDPNHLVMQNLGSFDSDAHRELYKSILSLKDNDVLQVHRYIDEGASLPVCQAPMDVLTSDVVKELLAFGYNRPIVISETGAVEPRHAGPFRLYPKDKSGIILHDLLFAPFFSGAAAPGQSWHWDYYLEFNNLWYHFGRFNEAVKGINPIVEDFKPMQIDHPQLRIYILKGKNNVLVWCRDKKNDWKSELLNDVAPQMLRNVEVDLGSIVGGMLTKNAQLYNPWTNLWKTVSSKNGKVVIPMMKRSMVIRLSTK